MAERRKPFVLEMRGGRTSDKENGKKNVSTITRSNSAAQLQTRDFLAVNSNGARQASGGAGFCCPYFCGAWLGSNHGLRQRRRFRIYSAGSQQGFASDWLAASQVHCCPTETSWVLTGCLRTQASFRHLRGNGACKNEKHAVCWWRFSGFAVRTKQSGAAAVTNYLPTRREVRAMPRDTQG